MDRSIKILVTVLIVGIIGFLGYSQVKRWHQSSIREVMEKESADCEERLASLREEMLKATRPALERMSSASRKYSGKIQIVCPLARISGAKTWNCR
jgi:predicted negative regulator of RcsB-dependent stress response